jgi:hypothetical protein
MPARPESAFWRVPDEPATYLSQPVTCPHCGYIVDAHESMSGGGPHDGAVSFCLRCGRFAMYVVTGLTLALRMPTDDERADVEREPSYQRLRAAWQSAYGPAGPNTHQDEAELLQRLREQEDD